LKKESQKQSNRKKKKVHVFFLFIVVSALLWTISKLSEEYIYTIKLQVNYTNFFDEVNAQDQPEKFLFFNFKTSGFNLIGLNNFKKSVNIDLKNIRKKNNLSYYLTNENLSNMQSQFSLDERILKIYPDTLFFNFGKLSSKTIKINPQIKINYKAGHALFGNLKISPKTVLIKGKEEQMSKINGISTVFFELDEVASNFDYNVKLDIPKDYKNVFFSTTTVNVAGFVKKYTENSYYIPFKVINVPDNFKIKTFKDKLKVTYRVSLDNFDRIKATDFSVICDFSKIDALKSSFLLPEIVKKPDLISNLKISPNKVEFLIVE